MRHCRCAVWYCGVAVSLSRFLHTVHIDKGFAVQKQVTDGNKAVSLSKCGLNKCRKILLYLIAVVVAVCVCGSLYLAGEIKKNFHKK